jgi:hypothetical protein
VARSKGRTGTPFRRAQAQCFAEETHCFFCGEYVDQTMANYRDRKARSVHHLIPPDVAPELANKRVVMRLSHIGCNASYGRGAYGGPRRRGAPSGQGRRTAVVRRQGWQEASAPSITSDREW